jgi:hypothetical protein
MNRFLIAILSFSFALPALAAEGFSSLEEQMSGKEFSAAGLEKLTPEELGALNNWIRRHSVATLPQAGGFDSSATAGGGGDQRGFENQGTGEVERSTIKSRLIGSFSGWDGNAIFTLENGMIWEQVDKDKSYIPEVQNPEVTIEPGRFKRWRLSIDGYNAECKVVRVQ